MKPIVETLLFLVALLVAIVGAMAGAPKIPTQLSGLALVGVALLPPLLVWCALAIRRAWLDHDSREHRAAGKELVQLCAQIVRRDGAPTMRDLERWRILTVRLWKMDRAAPTPAEIAAHTAGDSVTLQEWAALWQEAEEAMFSARASLPDDWLARATRAAEKFRPGLPPLPIPRRRRHWLPLATAAALMVFGGAKLDGAESAPREDEQPTDLTTRKNKARAFVQQEKWGLAAANWTAAYLLNPRDETVATGVRIGLGKIESPDPRLVGLVTGPWYDRVVGWLAPAQWERLAGTAAAATGVCLTITVALLYFDRSARRRRAAFACALLVGGGAFVAYASFRRYGLLANPQAAFVVVPTELRSIPSDIAASQPAVTLSPGTIAVVDRSFFGWDHVSARGNATGWIRTETVVWLYRTRSHAQIRADYAE